MPEKLLSIKEVAEYLKISEEEVKRLVDAGELPAYRIGDTFLRFRREQVDAVKAEISLFEKEDAEHVVKASVDSKGKETHPYSDLEKTIKRREPITRKYDYTGAERMSDFIYFNDFYLISGAIVAVLLFLIFKA